MKALVPFWFTPNHQPLAEKVEFQLRPLDLRTLYTVQNGITEKGGISSEAAIASYEHAVIGWRGLAEEFTGQAKRAVLLGAGDLQWMIWLGEIAAEVYKRALLSDEEKKTS